MKRLDLRYEKLPKVVQRNLLWLFIAFGISIFSTQIAYQEKKALFSKGCGLTGIEFLKEKVRDTGEMYPDDDAMFNDEFLAATACQKAFEQIENKDYTINWILNIIFPWILFSLGCAYGLKYEKEI